MSTDPVLLTSLPAATPALDDLMYMVDVSDTTDKPAGSDRRVTVGDLLDLVATTITTATETTAEGLLAGVDGTVEPVTLGAGLSFDPGTATLSNTLDLSGYLPLTGGTLTGGLVGTTATFSGAVNFPNSATITTSGYLETYRATVGGGSGAFNNYPLEVVANGASYAVGSTGGAARWSIISGSAFIPGATTNSITFGAYGGPLYFVGSGGSKAVSVHTNGLLGVNVAGGVTPSAQLHVVANSASTVGAIIQGATGQTALLTSWQTSTGTDLVVVTAAGKLGIGTSTPGATDANNLLEIVGTNNPLVRVTGTSGHFTALSPNSNFFSGGSAYTFYGPTTSTYGSITAGAATFGGAVYSGDTGTANYLRLLPGAGGGTGYVGSSGAGFVFFTRSISTDAVLTVNSQNAADVVLTVKGITGQTANLTEWKNPAGTVIASVSASGNVTAPTVLLTPGAGSTAMAMDGWNVLRYESSNVIAFGGISTGQWQGIRLYTGGVSRLDIDSAGAATFSGAVVIPAGAYNAPSLSFGGTFGWYSNSGNWAYTTTGGLVLQEYTNSALKLHASGTFSWSNTVNNATAAVDTSLARNTSGGLLVTSTVAGQPTAVVRGATSQTANLQEWQNSTGTVLAKVDANGFTTVAGGRSTGGWQVQYGGTTVADLCYGLNYNLLTTRNAAYQALVVKGDTSQTANLQEWQDSTGTVLAGIGPAGRLGLGAAPSVSTSKWIQFPNGHHIWSDSNTLYEATSRYWYVTNTSNGVYPLLVDVDASAAQRVLVDTFAAGVKGLVVKGATSQSANLQEWQNSTGTVLTSVSKDGNVGIVAAASASYRLDIDTGSGSVDGIRVSGTGTGARFRFNKASGVAGTVFAADGSMTQNAPITVTDSQSGAAISTFTNNAADGYGVLVSTEGSSSKYALLVSNAAQTVQRFRVDNDGKVTLSDGGNVAVGTTTGTKIGTDAAQKLAFWNASPVVQQVLATGAGATVDDVIALLQALGLCRQS